MVLGLEQAVKLYMQVTEFGGARREVIGSYEVSEVASMLPLMTDEEFQELQRSIEDIGLREPIRLNADGAIVDGRNRMLACMAADIDPQFDYSDLDDPQYVDVKNMKRRNLSASARAQAYLMLKGLPADESIEEDTDDSEVTAPVDLKPEQEAAAKAAQVTEGRTRKIREAAKEAGVGMRTMQRAVVVDRDAIPEVKEAVIQGQMTVKDAEVVSKLPAEDQRQIVTKKDENQSAAAVKERDRKAALEASWKTFDLAKWMRWFEATVSRILAKVPPDLRDRCHRHMAETLGSTVRVEREQEDLLNSESIVGYVEELVKNLPKSERASSEQALASHYSAVVKVKDSGEAVEAINRILGGLSATQKKQAIAEIQTQYPVSVKKSRSKGETKAVG